ncbi:uncharacterized protein FMAN_12504 [Fusarium mangiferae]|uniref:Uncharacterized protein n=1 Tax=Fusarium mangiferae TaxID=192010 RepID=A0A1L7TNY2_FUSMA|nr:uncharacterized protein FMAN_12504 [Fusarium mangiferae]CVK98532.1 uncharacterized protein FMAN_12504 [Fusarium mangiferae]
MACKRPSPDSTPNPRRPQRISLFILASRGLELPAFGLKHLGYQKRNQTSYARPWIPHTISSRAIFMFRTSLSHRG